MKKLMIIGSTLLFMATSSFAGMKKTEDMVETAAEYENTNAQWHAKEALGLLFSEIVYTGWKVEVNKKGEKTVDVKWKNSFTSKILKKDLGNSTQYLKTGLATLIGDKVAPLTEAEAVKFLDDMRLALLLEDLRIRYDNDNKQFKEEYGFLAQYGIIKFTNENEMLQKNGELSEWRDEVLDEYSDFE